MAFENMAVWNPHCVTSWTPPGPGVNELQPKQMDWKDGDAVMSNAKEPVSNHSFPGETWHGHYGDFNTSGATNLMSTRNGFNKRTIQNILYKGTLHSFRNTQLFPNGSFSAPALSSMAFHDSADKGLHLLASSTPHNYSQPLIRMTANSQTDGLCEAAQTDQPSQSVEQFLSSSSVHWTETIENSEPQTALISNLFAHPDRVATQPSSVHIVFLPAEEHDATGGAKYNRIAKVVRLKDGMLKLFAERGRCIETRITLEDVDTAVVGTIEYKLRFIPYTSCGGVCKPVVGCHNQVQPAQPVITEQLCFVQLFEDKETTSSRYKTDENGYLFLETPLIGCCGIYQLRFPFHNSQCPTTSRKDVYVQVSVVQTDGLEVGRTVFQVISSASPLRDSNRFCARQAALNRVAPDTPRKSLTGKQPGVEHGSTSEPRSKTSVAGVDEYDISPGSSGATSFGSPLPLGLPDDEFSMVNARQYLPHRSTESASLSGLINNPGRPDPHIPQGSILTTDPPLHQTGIQMVCGASAATPQSEPIWPQIGMSEKLKDGLQVDETFLEADVDSGKGGDEDSESGREYIIRTKSWRVYCILMKLGKELTETYESGPTNTKQLKLGFSTSGTRKPL